MQEPVDEHGRSASVASHGSESEGQHVDGEKIAVDEELDKSPGELTLEEGMWRRRFMIYCITILIKSRCEGWYG